MAIDTTTLITGGRYVGNPACRCRGFPVVASVAVPLGGDCYNDTAVEIDCPDCDGETRPIKETAPGYRCRWCGMIDTWHSPEETRECLARLRTQRAVAILENYDLNILSDCTEAEGSTEDHPILKPCFYIGWHSEMAAGIWGGSIGPIFDSVEEAQEWVGDNEASIRAEMGPPMA